MWKDIKNAPKVIGDPVWVKGFDFGDPTKDVHYCWAYWTGTNWNQSGFNGATLLYLTHYKDDRHGPIRN